MACGDETRFWYCVMQAIYYSYILQVFNPDREQILGTSSNNHIRLIQNAFFYRFDFYICDHQQHSIYYKEGTHAWPNGDCGSAIEPDYLFMMKIKPTRS
jgi:hypothetical protein